jgi:hypothetical protein
MVLVVVANPVNAEHDKADGIHQELGPQTEQDRSKSSADKVSWNLRHPNVENHQGHGDCKHAVAESLDASLC